MNVLLRNCKQLSYGIASTWLVIAGLASGLPVFGQTKAYVITEVSNENTTQVSCKLNNLGDIVGRATTMAEGQIRATVWGHSDRKVKHLGVFSGGDYSSASDVNDNGDVAGASNTLKAIVPFIFTAQNGLQRIALLRDDTCGQAMAINKYRHVVGFSSGRFGRKAFLWKHGAATRDLGALPGGTYSRACDINDADEIVGTSGSGAGERAVLWTTSGNLRDLGTLPGDSASEAAAINNNGDVVGYSKGPRGLRSFVWTKELGMEE